MPKTVLLDLLEKMLERLAYLHENLYMVHRDPHFDQWFIQSDDSLILTDFSFAAVLGKDGVIPAGEEPLFTPICMSPEQVRYLEQTHSFNSDVWMLGCWFSQISSLPRRNCFQEKANDIFKGVSDSGAIDID